MQKSGDMYPQICGYLEPKHPEIRKLSLASPLFARRKARREWVVLDAISFKLLAFHDEESASNPKKDPLYTVPLINAAFRVEPESPSTFSIFSGRKYTYQAENRNAMLAWLSCLQACRDSEGSEIKHVNYDGNEKSERWSSNLSLNHRFSDFNLLRSDSKTYSFTSLKSGVLKARFSPHEATDTTSPSLVASPVMDDTHFFPEDKPQPPSSTSPSQGKTLHIGSDSGSLSEMDEVNNFMKVEFQQTLEKIERLRKVNEEMESELHDLRIGYASLLQSCYKYKLGGALESDRYADLPISDKHKIRVGHLLEIARREDPRLPSASLISSRGGHMNTYGFQESFEKEESTMLYLASLLLDTYKLNSPPEELKIAQWNEILNSNFSLVPRQRLKELCRSGIPGGIRPEVWKELVKLGAKLFQLNMDPQHYQNLTDRVKDGQVDSSCRRQITLDVLRTFPNHVAFNRPEGFGVQKMQEVLQAFTIHNQEVGYCQGMNFIVGNASLFLDKETTFWLLVLIVERYFPQKYFNEGLIAAQADQIVLRDLIAKYCPRIAKAMQELEVDISTITLNWFIAVYVSTVPIETLLRIWDVFLLEGEKVLFRVAIALLLQQQDILLRQSDTLAFWKSMKIAVSLVYDYEELLSIAFNGFKMVKRKELKSRREAKMRELEKRHQLSCALDELKAKGQVNNISGRDAPQSPRTFFASALDESSPCFIMSCAENDSYVLKLGNTDEDVYYAIEGRFDAPITCAAWIKDSHILLGSAKGYLYAYDIGPKQKTWELKMSGGITAITIDRQRGGTKHAFVGTANGILSLIVDLTGETAPRDLYSQILGFIAVSFISIIDTQLWCACGCVLEVFDVTTFDHIRKITVSENPLDSICCLAPCSNGVWISLVGKTSLKLLSTSTFEPTCYCDISRYLPSRGSNALLESENPDRVTAVLANDSYLFIGTGSGIVCIYKTLKWKNSTLPHVKKLQTSTRHSINISEYKTSPKILSRSLHRLTSKEEGDSDIDEVPCNAAPEIGSPRSGSQDAINFSSCTDTTVEDEKPTLLKGAVPRMRGPLVNSLNLLFNIKSQITESPIRAFLQVTNKQGNCIVSISQRSNEDDAVLKWVQKNKGGCPWTNEPMFELCLKDSTPILPGYLKSATLRKIPSVDSTFHLQ